MQLGSLEKKIMDRLWQQFPEQSFMVRDVASLLSDEYAYTTLQTVITHLYSKKLLQRKKNGKAYMYNVRVSKAEFIKRTWLEFVHGMRKDYGSVVLAHFADALDDIDPEVIKRAKKQLNK